MRMFYHSYPQPTVQLSFLSSTSQLCDLLLFLDNHVNSSDKGEECQWSAFNLGSSASNETVLREAGDLTPRNFWGGASLTSLILPVSKCAPECSPGPNMHICLRRLG